MRRAVRPSVRLSMNIVYLSSTQLLLFDFVQHNSYKISHVFLFAAGSQSVHIYASCCTSVRPSVNEHSLPFKYTAIAV